MGIGRLVFILCFDLLTRPKMPFKVIHRKELTHSNGSYERKSRGRKLADEMGQAKKNPMVHYRVMHRKRVTSELHDSYFHLMTIKLSISKFEWASNDYITQLSSTSQLNCSGSSWVRRPGGQWSCQKSSRQLESSGGREGHTRPRGALGNPDWVWGPEKMLHPAEWALGLRLSSPREQERHNVTVITVGSKYYSLCSVSSSLSHANLEQPFRTLAIKWEVNIL